MPGPLAIYAGAKAVQAGYNWYKAGKDRRSAKRNLSQFSDQYSQISDAEKRYLEMLKGQSEHGALPVQALENQGSARINEQSRLNRSRVNSFSANRGMEDSVIGQSHVGLVDANATRAAAEMAKSIYIQNEMTKQNAVTALGNQGMRETDANRRLAGFQFDARNKIRSGFNSQVNQGFDAVGDAAKTYAGMKSAQDNAPFTAQVVGEDGNLYGLRNNQWILIGPAPGR